VVMVCVAGSSSGQPPKPCFAYLLRGDVSVTCEGRTTQITRRGDIQDFAVSNEQSAFVYATEQVIRRTQTRAFTTVTNTVVDLKSRNSKRKEGYGLLASTCGSLLLMCDGNSHDLMTGRELSFPPYGWFCCSSDRKTVVGTINRTNHGYDLYDGLPPKTMIPGARSYGGAFNISPDGSKIAYHSNLKPLCVFSSPDPVQCVQPMSGDFIDFPSVNDSGEVLVATHTGRHASTRTFTISLRHLSTRVMMHASA